MNGELGSANVIYALDSLDSPTTQQRGLDMSAKEITSVGSNERHEFFVTL